jgi:hypothetical protein
VEGADVLAGAQPAVGGVCRVQRLLAQHPDHGVDARVRGVDAVEVRLHRLAAGHPLLADRRGQLAGSYTPQLRTGPAGRRAHDRQGNARRRPPVAASAAGEDRGADGAGQVAQLGRQELRRPLGNVEVRRGGLLDAADERLTEPVA